MHRASSESSRFHAAVMRLGRLSGCHQLPERSFFLRGSQFPVCARCTGAFFGQLIGLCTCWLYVPHYAVLLLFCGIMFTDWFLQRINICESSNLRRLITGILCGYALIILHLALIFAAAAYLLDLAFAKHILASVFGGLV